MHRAIFGRGVVRTSVLIPYGIITVVAAFAWQFAFQPDTGFVNQLPFIADDKAWFGERFSSFVVIIFAEVWKTTPFIALLLLAGLTTIDDGLDEAAKVDGASAIQRFFRITLPLMKPAILVALLFRTLDAFRVFDTIFVMTRGAQDTESVSILGYNQLISRLNLGLGSAVSVLIFICVLMIAFLFVKGFGPASRAGRRTADGTDRPSRDRIFWLLGLVVIVFYALFPVLWIISLSLKTPATVTEFNNLGQALIPQDPTFDNYSALFTDGLDGPFLKPLINSIGIALIATVIAVVLASFAAYAIARLEFPGKTAMLAGALAIAMFPPISTIGPLFDMWRTLGLYDTWPGLIIPYLSFSLPLAIYTLVAFFREIPWDLEQAAQVDGATPMQAFRKVIVPARRAGHVHRGDPRLHLRLERLPVRDLADQLRRLAHGAGRARLLHRRVAVHPAVREHRGGRGDRHHPDHHLRADLPAPDRRRPDVRRGQGLTAPSKETRHVRNHARQGHQALPGRDRGGQGDRPRRSTTASS